MAYAQSQGKAEIPAEGLPDFAGPLELMERDFRYDPLYGVAMLKVSFNLRPQRWVGFDEILKDTLRELEVDEYELDEYVSEHRHNLEMACKMIGI